MIPALVNRNSAKISDIQYLAPDAPVSAQEDVDARLPNVLSPFSAETMAFLKELSQILLNEGSQQLPELVSLGYWIRPGNLKKLHQRLPQYDQARLMPLGTVLHITPSNVDIQFFYSWVLSLLMGNKNIVRVSQVESDSKTRLISLLQQLFKQPEHALIAQNNAFVTWPHDDEITSCVCEVCDARMIWGSDESVAHIKKIGAKLNCRDIVFSDRYSVSIVDTDVINEGNYSVFSEQLARDIGAFSQRACSSPRVIFNIAKQSCLNDATLQLINQKVQKNPISASRGTNHLVTEQMLKAKEHLLTKNTLSHLSVLKLQDFSPSLLDWHAGEYQLYWVNLESLEQLVEFIDEKCQTISYFGIDKNEILRIANVEPINLVDRIVPLGRSLEFDIFWDGYELFSQLSRRVSVI